MKIGIHGVGMVGGALKRYLERRGFEVAAKDPAKNYDDDFEGVECVFICVPVPTKGFKQDLSIVEEILITYKNSHLPIFLRSTVVPGTADQLAERFNCKLISMPEFLTERYADLDVERIPVIHGPGANGIVRKIFTNATPLENKECELAKYAHNCFGAMKVTYFNFIHSMCKKLNIKYENVLEGVLNSGHINRAHTSVPGPDGQYGFGGACFPKDLEAFIGWTNTNAFNKVLLDIMCLNRFYRGIKDKSKLSDMTL